MSQARCFLRTAASTSRATRPGAGRVVALAGDQLAGGQRLGRRGGGAGAAQPVLGDDGVVEVPEHALEIGGGPGQFDGGLARRPPPPPRRRSGAAWPGCGPRAAPRRRARAQGANGPGQVPPRPGDDRRAPAGGPGRPGPTGRCGGATGGRRVVAGQAAVAEGAGRSGGERDRGRPAVAWAGTSRGALAGSPGRRGRRRGCGVVGARPPARPSRSAPSGRQLPGRDHQPVEQGAVAVAVEDPHQVLAGLLALRHQLADQGRGGQGVATVEDVDLVLQAFEQDVGVPGPTERVGDPAELGPGLLRPSPRAGTPERCAGPTAGAGSPPGPGARPPDPRRGARRGRGPAGAGNPGRWRPGSPRPSVRRARSGPG